MYTSVYTYLYMSLSLSIYIYMYVYMYIDIYISCRTSPRTSRASWACPVCRGANACSRTAYVYRQIRDGGQCRQHIHTTHGEKLYVHRQSILKQYMYMYIGKLFTKHSHRLLDSCIPKGNVASSGNVAVMDVLLQYIYTRTLCMYICICVCVCTCVYTYIYIYMYTCICVLIITYMYYRNVYHTYIVASLSGCNDTS